MPTKTSIPSATYRLQFHRGFTFQEATVILDYLKNLGISHVYSSPFFQASEDSTHGYDVADHNRISPAVGTSKDYDGFVAGLRERELGHILDFVPNHMGISEPVNRWWMDVLENGQSSLYAEYFDIEWHPIKEELENKVLLPILGERYGKVLEKGQFKLSCEEGAFFLNYFDAKVPINPRSYPRILDRVVQRLADFIQTEARDELMSISTAFDLLPYRTNTNPEAMKLRAREKEVSKHRLARLLVTTPPIAVAVEDILRELEGIENQPESFDALHDLLCDQPYRLAYWRVAAEEINYRRFFDITSLAAIRSEVREVFDASHHLVLQMIERGEVTGLRIDHIDGLWNPRAYLEQLQQNVTGPAGGAPLYLLVEKILGPGEYLPADWPVHGTTGYEFVSDVTRLLVDQNAVQEMSDIYATFGNSQSFEDLVYEKKILVTRMALASEIAELGHLLDQLSEKNRHYRDFTRNQLTAAIRETIASFSVYRTYVASDRPTRKEDRLVILKAIRQARRRNPSIDRQVFDYLAKILTLDPADPQDEALLEERVRFAMKFQQISGPVMAKGLEDTAFYIYNRLVALNDVGGEPGRFGSSVEDFHATCRERLQRTPHTLLASSTHDTKRSEDVRARIAAISEFPEDWRTHLDVWRKQNATFKTEVDGQSAPSLNEEYLLYQTLVGAWPVLGLSDAERPDFIRRIQEYMLKALKEAKINSSWIESNEEWENATHKFVAEVLDPLRNADFLNNFSTFARRIAEVGAMNSLTQTVLKFTTPGVPDLYQGCELWDFSLVDPDNRRPVDYAHRRQELVALEGVTPAELLENWPSGRIKLFVIHTLLRLRNQKNEVFQSGDYLPLEIMGGHAENSMAFLRQTSDESITIIAPRLTASLAFPPLGETWADTRILFPTGHWKDIFTGVEHQISGEINLSKLLQFFPVACLVRNQ